jgi:hypothetical protein
MNTWKNVKDIWHTFDKHLTIYIHFIQKIFKCLRKMWNIWNLRPQEVLAVFQCWLEILGRDKLDIAWPQLAVFLVISQLDVWKCPSAQNMLCQIVSTRTFWLRICSPQSIEELAWFECWMRLQYSTWPGAIMKLILGAMHVISWTSSWSHGCNARRSPKVRSPKWASCRYWGLCNDYWIQSNVVKRDIEGEAETSKLHRLPYKHSGFEDTFMTSMCFFLARSNYILFSMYYVYLNVLGCPYSYGKYKLKDNWYK